MPSSLPRGWEVFDQRTGRRVSVASYISQATAELAIERTRRNVERGLRPDLADLIDHLAARPRTLSERTPGAHSRGE